MSLKLCLLCANVDWLKDLKMLLLSMKLNIVIIIKWYIKINELWLWIKCYIILMLILQENMIRFKFCVIIWFFIERDHNVISFISNLFFIV